MEEKEKKKEKKGLSLISSIFPTITLSFILIRALEIIIIVLLFKYLPFSFYAKVPIISFLFAVYILIKTKDFRSARKTFLSFTITIYILGTLNIYLGGLGTAGFVLSVLLFAGFRLWRQRKLYLRGLRTIETSLFGKALDKENFKDGERPVLKTRS